MQYDASKIKKIGEIKRQALNSLSGRWGTAILVCFIYGIILKLVSYTVNINSGANYLGNINSIVNSYADSYQMGNLSSGSGVVLKLGQLVNLIVGGPLLYGLSYFFLSFVRQTGGKVEDLFSGFKRFGKTFLLNLILGIFKILWAMLVFIPTTIIAVIIFLPGIMYYQGYADYESMVAVIIGSAFFVLIVFSIAGIIYSIIVFRYELAFYVANDNEEYEVMACINESKDMMKGFKLKLFLLYLSFIGWGILSIITIGIGFLWLTPYINASKAVFYDNLREAYFGEEEKEEQLVIES